VRSAGHPQGAVLAVQVAEAGCEAAEADRPRLAGVRRDHLVAGQADQLGHVGQVRAVVVDTDLHLGGAPSGGAHGLELQQLASSLRTQRLRRSQEDRPRSGHHLGDLVEIEPLQGA